MTYSDGTTTRVKTVVMDKPKMIAIDMFCHHCVDSLLVAHVNVWKS